MFQGEILKNATLRSNNDGKVCIINQASIHTE